MSTASSSLRRCVSPPPSSTALFSKCLRPGRVFLVQATLTLPPLSLLAVETSSAVAVATPDMWDISFSSVRSMLSSARAGRAPEESPCGPLCVHHLGPLRTPRSQQVGEAKALPRSPPLLLLLYRGCSLRPASPGLRVRQRLCRHIRCLLL